MGWLMESGMADGVWGWLVGHRITRASPLQAQQLDQENQFGPHSPNTAMHNARSRGSGRGTVLHTLVNFS